MSLLSRVTTTLLLDIAGLILLCAAAFVWHVIAGLAASGISCLLVSWRVGDR